MTHRIPLATVFLCLSAATASAQSFTLDFHSGVARWSEFFYLDRTDNEREPFSDIGVGARVAWRPATIFSAEAYLTLYPQAFPIEPRRFPDTFSRRRVEALFGGTVGPQIGRVRPFAKVSGGLLNVAKVPTPFACIQVVPPPITCVLADGRTLPAFEIGGGVEISASSRYLIRVDVSERILRYPGPSRNIDFEAKDEGFFGHALRFTGGFGFRF